MKVTIKYRRYDGRSARKVFCTVHGAVIQFRCSRGLRRRPFCHSLASIAGSHPAGGKGVFILRILSDLQVPAAAKGRSLVQGSPTNVCVRVCVCVCVRE